eukprot:1814042-Rhodomonas_salina.1
MNLEVGWTVDGEGATVMLEDSRGGGAEPRCAVAMHTQTLRRSDAQTQTHTGLTCSFSLRGTRRDARVLTQEGVVGAGGRVDADASRGAGASLEHEDEDELELELEQEQWRVLTRGLLLKNQYDAGAQTDSHATYVKWRNMLGR